MSSEQQQIDEKSSKSETHTPQQWDVSASEVSESVASRSIPNVPTMGQDNDDTHGHVEYVSSSITGSPAMIPQHSRHYARSQSETNQLIASTADKDQKDILPLKEPWDNDSSSLLSHLEDTISPGPTALSPPPRSYRDRAKREAKGPVLFSDPEDAEPATQRVSSASEVNFSRGKSPFIKKHVRNGTFGQFASFGLGSNTMDDATTLAAKSDEENDSEPNSDEENDSIPNSDSEGRSD